ncbi:MAG TPA: hypothetical protein PKD26_08780 [Pyrinomonadaceae bacterium]|nr:hypothetical protein [Pyrinomonadaceae bacterium]
MSKARPSAPRDFGRRFSFVAFGVPISLESDHETLLEKSQKLVKAAFGGRARIVADPNAGIEHRFRLVSENGNLALYRNGILLDSGPSERHFLQFLNHKLRLEVAEHTKHRVFIHAGVVGWNGKAIVLPGVSFAGKSTLTAELVRNGAEYYSDEYAVIDKTGKVGPFPRLISLRLAGDNGETGVSAEALGGVQGRHCIPVGMVLFTRFSKGSKWMPEELGVGAGIMELIPNTLTMRQDPAFSLKVLDLVAQRAIMVRSPRGEAGKFAKFLLDFFDKHTKLAKMT